MSHAPYSRLALGCWGLTSDFHWGPRDASDSAAAIEAAVDGGITLFDTAAVYAEGESERLLGRVLSGRRAAVQIASKVHPTAIRPDQVIASCEASLERLGTDYLDLYQVHWASPDVPVADTWDAMIRLQEQGKVRQLGVCNFGPQQLAATDGPHRPVTNQLPYNLLWRAIEFEILPACRQHQLDVLAYSPLMHGLLAGHYATADEVPDGRARSRHFRGERAQARHGEPGCEAATFAALQRIGEIADQAGRTMAELALAWLLAKEPVTSVIVGARTADQLAANLQVLERPLSGDTVTALDEATLPLREALGANADMWQGTAGSRIA